MGASHAPLGTIPIDDGLHCRVARRDELHAAFRIILGQGGRAASDGDVLDFLQFAIQRKLTTADTWVAERRGRIAWGTLPIVSPGRTMLLFAPSNPPRPDAAAAAGALVNAICEHFAGRGVHLVQVLIDPAAQPLAALYESLGFGRMAELLYLQSDLRPGLPYPPLPDGFDWLTYSPAAHDLFAETIAASYEGSLDCPGLNGMREIEDVVAGHRASGEFDPSTWLLLRERTVRGDGSICTQPRAVLLLARLPGTDAVELVYFGLAPDSRGRGLGQYVLRHALALCAARGMLRLTLAVDANNAPALKLYYRHGFTRAGSKLALMRDLRPLRIEPEPRGLEGSESRHETQERGVGL